MDGVFLNVGFLAGWAGVVVVAGAVLAAVLAGIWPRRSHGTVLVGVHRAKLASVGLRNSSSVIAPSLLASKSAMNGCGRVLDRRQLGLFVELGAADAAVAVGVEPGEGRSAPS